MTKMASPTASKTAMGIVADQEEEKIQEPLSAGTFCIPGALTAIGHIFHSRNQPNRSTKKESY
jgi:hypothetical protein